MIPFCISIPETPQRTERAQAHFAERGVAVNFLHYGINAEKFGIQTAHTYEVDNPGTNFHIGYKPTGIWLSHYMLWNILSFLPDEHFMVVEIDAKFPSDWKVRVDKAMADVPKDFDMLYIGSCCCQGRPTTHIKGDVFMVQWPLCTHAYVVAKKALPMLLSTQRRVYAPIDISLAFHSHPQLKVFTVLPRIIEQFDTVIPP